MRLISALILALTLLVVYGAAVYTFSSIIESTQKQIEGMRHGID